VNVGRFGEKVCGLVAFVGVFLFGMVGFGEILGGFVVRMCLTLFRTPLSSDFIMLTFDFVSFSLNFLIMSLGFMRML
jgi:hypothetical protein